MSIRCPLDDPDAPGDGGNDADRIALVHAGLILLQVANILVVHVYVHEAAQAPVIGKQMLLQVRELAGERGLFRQWRPAGAAVERFSRAPE